jgi:CBS domain-containing protein
MPDKLVGDAMHTGLFTCPVDAPMEEVVRILCGADVHALVVVDADGYARGILSHMDIMAHYGEALYERKAGEIMTPQVVSVTPLTPLGEAVKLMAKYRIHRLLVTEPGPSGSVPVGILSTGDVIRDIRGASWAWKWD